MYKLLPIITLLATLNIFGQITAERFVIGSAGATATASTLLVDYTIGETVVTTSTGNNFVVTQGFHQPTDQQVSTGTDPISLTVRAFPNPTQHTVHITATMATQQQLTMAIYNVSGQSVMPPRSFRVADQWSHTVDFSGLASGTYIVHLKNQDASYGSTLTIQKTQ